MIDFEQLTVIAAVGVGTRPVPVAELPPQVAAGVSGDEPAQVMLDAAAGYAVVLRSRVPDGPDAPALRLPAPTRPAAPAAAVALLRRVRAGGRLQEALQREALGMLADRGYTLPPDLLIELLGELRRPDLAQPDLARQLAGLLDDRGWALAGLNPAWDAALARGGGVADAADPRWWLEGTVAQRLEYFVALRGSDPAVARALLEDPGFAKEPAETRERLVQQLLVNLGPGDEAFLETRLDDRAKGVRETAAGVLAHLRGSAYLGRAEALASRHLQRRPRLLRATLNVLTGLPATVATRRDQYPTKDGQNTPLERLQALHVIGLVPTERWPALAGADAVELATSPHEYNGSAVDAAPAWIEAAVRWRDTDLAIALVEQDPARIPSLLPVLSPVQRSRYLSAALRSGRLTDLGAITQLLPRRADGTLAAAVVDTLRRESGNRGRHHQFPEVIRALALAADPAIAGPLADDLRDLDARLPDNPGPAVRRAINEATAALQLRQALSEALPPPPVRKDDR